MIFMSNLKFYHILLSNKFNHPNMTNIKLLENTQYLH